jgi:hypothetical protein
MNKKRKHRGGTDKNLEQKKKMLLIVAGKCQRITNMFKFTVNYFFYFFYFFLIKAATTEVIGILYNVNIKLN